MKRGRPLKDPMLKNSKPSNELMMDPNEIRYQCPVCCVLFNGIPDDECKYCGTEYKTQTFYEKNNKKPPVHMVLTNGDYNWWSSVDGDISRV